MTAGAPLRVSVMEVGPLMVNAYIVEDPDSKKAVVIDPGDDGDALLGEIRTRGLSVEKILLTHGHFDHVGAVRLLRDATGAAVYLHGEDAGRMATARRQGLIFGLSVGDQPPPDVVVAEGDRIAFGGHEFLVVHTPGHTPGCVCYLCGKMAFVGDLIFAGSIGRTDLPGGSHARLLDSVREKIFVLPDDTVLLPGHGPSTTVGEEKRTNPFFTGGY
ncbi:MAG: MBL fold metallo-hydrolase [Gemmatimonadota bacterium]